MALVAAAAVCCGLITRHGSGVIPPTGNIGTEPHARLCNSGAALLSWNKIDGH